MNATKLVLEELYQAKVVIGVRRLEDLVGMLSLSLAFAHMLSQAVALTVSRSEHRQGLPLWVSRSNKESE